MQSNLLSFVDDLWEVGLVLGVYQTSRALGNLIIVIFGGKNPFKRLQTLMSLVALFGWSFLSLFGRPGQTSLFSFTPYLSESDGGGTNDIVPLFALCCVGLGETIVILQRSTMLETAKESPSGIMDESLVAQRFTFQYAFVSFGSTAAYVLGGWIYTNIGYYAVCDFGMIVQFLHLMGTVVYLLLGKLSKESLKVGDALDGNDLIRSIIYQFQAASVISKYSQDVANGAENAMCLESQGLADAAIKAKSDLVLSHSLGQLYRHFFHKDKGGDDAACMEELLNSIDETRSNSSLVTKRPLAMSVGKQKLSKLVTFLVKSKGEGQLSEREFVSFWGPRVYLSMYEASQEANVNIVWPYMRAVVATQAIMALCIGTFLSTALLSYTQRFPERCDAAQVGLLLGIGEGAGVLIIFAKSFLSGKKYNESKSFVVRVFRAMISRPLNVPFILFVTSLSTMLFSIDSYIVAVTFQMVHCAVNDLSVSLMNELIGTSLPPEKFKYYQGIGQWLRRLGNMVTAILGPIFFGIDERLPFLFFGELFAKIV